jgi:transcriptional regulator with XRE-family HTH domain
MSRGRIALDQESFAADCASGLYTQEALAAKHGVSVSLINQIARGVRRPGLAERAAAVREETFRLAEQQLLGLVEVAIGMLGVAMAGGASPTALRAAQEVLNRTLGKVGSGRGGRGELFLPQPPRETDLDLMEFSPEFQRQIVAEMDEPSDEASCQPVPPDPFPIAEAGCPVTAAASMYRPPAGEDAEPQGRPGAADAWGATGSGGLPATCASDTGDADDAGRAKTPEAAGASSAQQSVEPAPATARAGRSAAAGAAPHPASHLPRKGKTRRNTHRIRTLRPSDATKRRTQSSRRSGPAVKHPG